MNMYRYSFLPLVISLLGIFVYDLFFKVRQKRGTRHMIGGFIFMLYLIVVLVEVVGFPSLKELMSNSEQGVPLLQPIFNTIPFNEGIELSDWLNLTMFVPLGFMLPLMWLTFSSFGKTLLYGVSLSLFIEFGQMFTSTRVTDINDFIMNTIGGIVGWLIWRILVKRGKGIPCAEKEQVNEWLVYPIVALLACFCF